MSSNKVSISKVVCGGKRCDGFCSDSVPLNDPSRRDTGAFWICPPFQDERYEGDIEFLCKECMEAFLNGDFETEAVHDGEVFDTILDSEIRESDDEEEEEEEEDDWNNFHCHRCEKPVEEEDEWMEYHGAVVKECKDCKVVG